MTKYTYCTAGEALAHELYLRCESAEPFILLGPPGAGKRMVLAKVRERLDAEQRPWMAVILRDHEPVHSEAALLRQMKDPSRCHWSRRIAGEERNKLLGSESLDSFFGQLQELDLRFGGLPFVTANLDGLTDELLFRFLSFIRIRQDSAPAPCRPMYALTGERLLQEHAGSPTSPIHPTPQFVLQSHDKATVREFCEKRIEAMQLRFHPSWGKEAAIDLLFELTQGDINITRVALLALSERRLAFNQLRESDVGLDREIFQPGLRNLIATPLYGLRLFHLAREAIEQHDEMLDLVAELVSKLNACPGPDNPAADPFHSWEGASLFLNDPKWRDYSARPTPLELTGLVRRNPRTLELKFASPFAAEFACSYYSPACLGDFFLKQRRFAEAIERYRTIPQNEIISRPCNQRDNRVVRVLVQRLCRRFNEMAEFPDADGRFFSTFTDFAQHLLGFRTASMWRFRSASGWTQLLGGASRASAKPVILDAVNFASLPLDDKTPMMQEWKDRWPSTSAYAVSFDHPASDGVAIVLEDRANTVALSGSRSRAAATLAHHFLMGWCRARDRYYLLIKQRSRLSTALKEMFRKETLEEGLSVFAKYLQEEVGSHAVRLYLTIPGDPNVMTSRFQVGLESELLAKEFALGEVVLRRDKYPLMFYSDEAGQPIMFRWIPEDPAPHALEECGLSYVVVRENPHAAKLERRRGDFWIDFPLLRGEEFFGKVTLAFRSSQPPPVGAVASLEAAFDLVAEHIGTLHEGSARYAELKDMHRRSLAGFSHDLAGRLSSLSTIAAQFLGSAEGIGDDTLRQELVELATIFNQRLADACNTTELAKQWLQPIDPGEDVFPIGQPIDKSLPTMDMRLGEIQVCGDTSVLVRGSVDHFDALFRQLISNSCGMFMESHRLMIRIAVTELRERGEIQIDFEDNGAGIPAPRKEKIFKLFKAYHPPGSRHRGIGLGLARVQEIICAYQGSIREIGSEGLGAIFRIILPVSHRFSK